MSGQEIKIKKKDVKRVKERSLLRWRLTVPRVHESQLPLHRDIFPGKNVDPSQLVVSSFYLFRDASTTRANQQLSILFGAKLANPFSVFGTVMKTKKMKKYDTILRGIRYKLTINLPHRVNRSYLQSEMDGQLDNFKEGTCLRRRKVNRFSGIFLTRKNTMDIS